MPLGNADMFILATQSFVVRNVAIHKLADNQGLLNHQVGP